MAEQKVTAAVVAEGRLEAERESQERSKALVSKQSDDAEMETSTTVLRSVQGELLPLIVDQLKTSLERGEGLGGGAFSGFMGNNSISSSSEEGPFDSGTESGDERKHHKRRQRPPQQQQPPREKETGGEEGDAEDEDEEDEELPMAGEFSSFMEGLKTSIEEAAARRRRERAPGDGEDSEGTRREIKTNRNGSRNEKNVADGLGEELLGEVHTALDKLQGTLQNSSGMDPEKSNALMALISRLQTSLEQEQESRKEKEPVLVPPPAAPPPRAAVPDWKARCQRKRQGRAHTVGVSQEELEDARRLLQQTQHFEKEEEEESKKVLEKVGEEITVKKKTASSEAPTAVNISEGKSYSLMKQSSAGELGPPSWASNSVAARVFRPVNFKPHNSPTWASMFNKTAKPFQREALGKTPPQAIQKFPYHPPSLPAPPSQPQLSSASLTPPQKQVAQNEPLKKTDCSHFQNSEATQSQVSLEQATALDSNSYMSQSHYVPPGAVSIPTPLLTSKPTWQAPFSPNPPTLSSSLTSSSTNGLSQRGSESSISGSISTKPETEEEEDEEVRGAGTAVKQVNENSEEEEEDNDEDNESEEVTQVTEREAYTNGVSPSAVRGIEPLLATASEFHPHEKRSVHHSLSLDSGTTKRGEETTLQTPAETVGTRASPLARSWTLDDPSAFLFTQAEKAQIAVHKAAIKKQLSHEERMKIPVAPVNGFGRDSGVGESIILGAAGEASPASQDSIPLGNGMVEHEPVMAREASRSRSDSYADSANEGRQNGDSVFRTTSGSSVSSVASSKNSPGIAVPNGIYNINNSVDNRNPPIPPRRESFPAGNAYDERMKMGDGGNYGVREVPAWSQDQSFSNKQSVPQAPTANYGRVDNSNLNKTKDRVNGNKDNSEHDFAEIGNHFVENSSRQQNKMEKKKKMKRANTIDIPKPLNFYVDDEDYSSGDELDEEVDLRRGEEGSSGLGTHRAAYLALRGPIRVKLPNSKSMAPSFQAKTENDRKFLAFLEQHSGTSVNRAEVQPTYHSSARGGAHWSNRFSNIKTSFEGTGRGSEHGRCYGRGRGVGRESVGSGIGGPASARNFWRAADDSVTRSRGNCHGPRLSREGSTLLRRLFEERDAAAAENRAQKKEESTERTAKLPWAAGTHSKGEDNVVVGSLTVASKKQLFSAMKASPPVPEVKAPVPVGKFSHAPLSAFRPIQSKDQSSTQKHGSIPLTSPGAVRLATQKFTSVPPVPASPPAISMRPQHPPLGQRGAFVPTQESQSPVGGPPPWVKEDAHERVQTSTARFENLSKEPSPPPTTTFVARSQVYNPVFMGSPQTVAAQSSTNVPPSSHHVDNFQASRQVQYEKPHVSVPTPPPRSIPPRGPVAPVSRSYEHQPLSHQYKSSHPSHSFEQMPPVRSYEQTPPPRSYEQTPPPRLYEQTPPLHSFEQVPAPRPKSPPPVLPPPPSLYLPHNTVQPSPPPTIPPLPRTLVEPPSPEPELQSAAVSRVMTGPVSQQAVVQKRRRGGDDEEEEEVGRESAVRNLSSAIHRLSVSPSRPQKSKSPSPQKPIDISPKDQAMEGNKVFNAETYLHPNRASLIVDGNTSQKVEEPTYRAFSKLETVTPKNSDRQIGDKNVPEKLTLKEQEEFYRKQLMAVREAQEAQRKCEEVQKEYQNRTSLSPYPPSHASVSPIPQRLQHASLTTDTRELNDESVVTMRLQIPVKDPDQYNSQRNVYSVSPVQTGLSSTRSNSHQDIRRSIVSGSPTQHRIESPRRDTEDRSPTTVLQKSESWHMLGQMSASSQNAKRPQSLALDQSKRRIPPSLPKMAFPKQFEARMSPETVETKQKRVEAYLKGQATGVKSTGNTPPPAKSKPRVPEPITPLLLDDNLENVDEAFESLFNAATKDKKVTGEKGQKTNKSPRPQGGLQKSQSQHLLRPPAPPRELSSSPQFQRKQKAWEESCMVKTKLAQNLSGSHSEATSVSSSTEASVTKTEVHTKTSNYSATVTGKSRVSKDVIDLVSSYF